MCPQRVPHQILTAKKHHPDVNGGDAAAFKVNELAVHTVVTDRVYCTEYF